MDTDTLLLLARQMGGRIKPCQVFNANVGEWASRELRSRLRGYRVAARESRSFVELEVKGINTPVCFSINCADRICLFDHPLEIESAIPYPVFVGEPVSQVTLLWLQDLSHASLFTPLQLTSDESLQVYQNGVVLIGQQQRATTETLDLLCDIADHLRVAMTGDVVDGLEFSVSELPEELQPLASLIRKFAIGDDAERSELLAQASAAEHERMRKHVGPLLPRIDQFLKSFGSRPLSNEAILLGRLAEAVAELLARK
jgi:hypothetical protein